MTWFRDYFMKKTTAESVRVVKAMLAKGCVPVLVAMTREEPLNRLPVLVLRDMCCSLDAAIVNQMLDEGLLAPLVRAMKPRTSRFRRVWLHALAEIIVTDSTTCARVIATPAILYRLTSILMSPQTATPFEYERAVIVLQNLVGKGGTSVMDEVISEFPVLLSELWRCGLGVSHAKSVALILGVMNECLKTRRDTFGFWLCDEDFFTQLGRQFRACVVYEEDWDLQLAMCEGLGFVTQIAYAATPDEMKVLILAGVLDAVCMLCEIVHDRGRLVELRQMCVLRNLYRALSNFSGDALCFLQVLAWLQQHGHKLFWQQNSRVQIEVCYVFYNVAVVSARHFDGQALDLPSETRDRVLAAAKASLSDKEDVVRVLSTL